MATVNFACDTLNKLFFLLCILVYTWGFRRATPWTLPFTHEFSKHWLLREWNQHINTVGQKKRKWRHLAHLVCVYLMPVANRAPILSQCSSRACSPVTDAPLSQTAATSITIAINYSPELCLLVYLWGLWPRPGCSNHTAGHDWTHVTWQPKPVQEMLLCSKSTEQTGWYCQHYNHRSVRVLVVVFLFLK